MMGTQIWIRINDSDLYEEIEASLGSDFDIFRFDNDQQLVSTLTDRPSIDPVIILENPFKNETASFDKAVLKRSVIVFKEDNYHDIKKAVASEVLDIFIYPIFKNEFRIKIERQAAKSSSPQKIVNGKLSFIVEGQNIEGLTSRQSQILSMFFGNPEYIVRRDDIQKRIWGEKNVTEKTIDVHLCNLRKKLKSHGLSIESFGHGQWKLQQNQ